MRKLLYVLVFGAVCAGCLLSCNEKPKNYRFIKVGLDGQEQVEDIAAFNDTDALKLYFDRMEKAIIANLDKPQEPYRAMYVVSPAGDTLNTNQALLEAVMKTLPPMQNLPTQEKDTIVLSTMPAKDVK